MKTFILVYNPVSGDAYFRYKLDSVIEEFQKRDCFLLPVRTGSNGDMTGFAALARAEAVNGIVIAGGDGTIHAVINAMVKYGIDRPVGLIPSGTSNDFAAYLGLDKDVVKCVDIIAAGSWIPVDIGMVNERYFINVASAGLLTSAAHNADTALKNTLGKVAYYLKGLGELPRFRALPMKIRADATVIHEDIFLFLVMNSNTVASFPQLAPNASINDGKLDLIVLKKCRVSELMTLFVSFLTGSHINHKHITYLQASEIVIESEQEMDSDLDGELGPRLPLRIAAVKDRIRIFVKNPDS